MTHLFKKSLLMLTLTATFAVAQTDTAMAQSLGFNEANAVLDLSTGEVTLELGTGLQVLGLVDAGGANIFDITAFDATTGLGQAGQLGSDGIGFLGLTPFQSGTFNLGAIISPPARTLDGVADFEFQFGAAGIPATTTSVADGSVTVLDPAVPICVGPEMTELQAFVDIGTGEVILELEGGGTLIDLIAGGSDIFDISAFDATTGLGPAIQLGSDLITFFNADPFSAGTFNLGPIIDDPFRTLEGIENLSLGGATVANGGITVINTIPEPGSLSLLALASLSVVARRRR